MPPSRSMRTDDEMTVQEPETTHVSVAHLSASETIPSDVLVASVEREDSVQTTPTRRILFKRLPNPLDPVEPQKRARGDEDDHSAFLSAYHHDLEKVSENLKNGVFSGTGMPDMLDSAWLAIRTKTCHSSFVLCSILQLPSCRSLVSFPDLYISFLAP